jgi:hypothetical protein
MAHRAHAGILQSMHEASATSGLLNKLFKKGVHTYIYELEFASPFPSIFLQLNIDSITVA